jgi:hypothetical protein
MEPFQQLRFNKARIPDLVATVGTLGFVVTRCDDSWLGSNYSDFQDLICERDELRTVLAVGPDRSELFDTSVVYVNMLGDPLIPEIRQNLEFRGAEWSYFFS